MELIDGVIITPLKKIPDERGCIYHMLREDSPVYERFGEIYFSLIHPSVIKAWHYHINMKLNYACVHGQIKLVLYDDRGGSSTHGNLMELFIGDENYVLVTIPPRVWNGFKGIGTETAIVANCTTIFHDPNEILREDPFTKRIPYNWDVKHG